MGVENLEQRRGPLRRLDRRREPQLLMQSIRTHGARGQGSEAHLYKRGGSGGGGGGEGGCESAELRRACRIARQQHVHCGAQQRAQCTEEKLLIAQPFFV